MKRKSSSWLPSLQLDLLMHLSAHFQSLELSFHILQAAERQFDGSAGRVRAVHAALRVQGLR
eukprot:6226497-Alexandrium_andersonii.AAC.1